MLIRPVDKSDAEKLLEIYSYYITDTLTTLEVSVPSLNDYWFKILSITEKYPFLVCECNKEVVGFTYASSHRDRAGYCYSADVSVYLSPDHHRKGLGKALYENLFEALKGYNYFTASAGIVIPNEKSLALHKKFNFREVGVFHNIGYKNGKWLDVLRLEKQLKPYQKPI